MRLVEVMTSGVEVIDPGTPVAEAAARMAEFGRGLLPVGDAARVVGLLVGRDIAERVAAAGLDPGATPVRDVMTLEVVFGYEDQDVTEAVGLMREKKYMHLLVLDRAHKLSGIVSLADLAEGGGETTPGDALARAPMPAQLAIPAYTHLLVALDGSHLADRILPHVVLLARTFGSAVTLLRAVTPPSPDQSAAATPQTGAGVAPEAPAAPVVDPTTFVETERREGLLYLMRLVGSLRALGLTADYAQPDGAPAAAIVAEARARGVDLIAMTSHGRGGLGERSFGSVAATVLREAPCPLLLVRVDEGG